jgi:hypothetical protein
MTDVRIRIDLNVLDRDGLTRAKLSDVVNAAALLPGQSVVAFEPEDGVSAPAVVDRIEGSFVLLRVDFDSLDDDITETDSSEFLLASGVFYFAGVLNDSIYRVVEQPSLAETAAGMTLDLTPTLVGANA